MKISARNILSGKVTAIQAGPISTLVTIKIAPKVEVTASITSESAQQLGLAVGKPAYALIKASSILVGTD